jgi:exodeoxyribonuclease V beta subunit
VANFHLHSTDVPTGLSVIEASAGTGKTWTIAHLLPRLLVDGDVNDIGQVLLVTFTEDAARELGERTRRQLATLVSHADASTDPGDGEGGIRVLLDRLQQLDDTQRDAALVRLRLALAESDQLAVSTIHAFCKQVLASESFLCGMPAGFQVQSDASELKADAVKDTWRTDLAADSLLAAVAALGNWSVERDLKTWRTLTQRPSTRMDPEPPSLEEARNRVAQALEALKVAREDTRRLTELAQRDKVKLNCSASNPGEESVAQLDAWHTLLDTMDPQQPPVQVFRVADRLKDAASWFARRNAAGKAASAEAGELGIVAAATAVCATIGATGWAWLAHLSQSAGHRFERSLRRHNGVTFDGLIQKLHYALCVGPNRAALARRLADKWTVGLIDESQDTDQQQLEIFKAIFDGDGQSGRLILVGDPKQAIYGFRGGDLDAYLAARPANDDDHDTERVSNLATTYRAAPGLVEALNAVFGRDRAFGNPALTYPEASSARTDSDLPLPADGARRLVAWVVTDDDTGPWAQAQPRRERAAACTATAIVDLLGRPLGTAGAASEMVNPSHVAVLTRTNEEARLVHQALRARNVPAVVRDDGDVMQSETASDLASILKAVLSPTHPGWRLAAMATRLFGYDSGMLADLTTADAELRLTRFSAWGDVWRRQGIAALMAALETESDATLRLARAPSGERHLTDLRHLEELLAAREAEGHRSPETLLQWFDGERMSEGSTADERLRRLEADGAAVQVVTMHGVKGLEFDFVYCPFLWSVNPDASATDRLLVRRDDGWVLADGSQRDNRTEHRARTAERLLEDLRLTYVAVTRARRRVTLLAGPLGYEAKSHTLPPTSLDWLLRSINETDEQTDSLEDWYAVTRDRKRAASSCEHRDTLFDLQKAHPDVITVSDPPALNEAAWTPDDLVDDILQARQAPTLDLNAWSLTSFSRLAHGRHEERERRDHAAVVVEPPADMADKTTAATGGPDLDREVPLATFARGIQAGSCLHELLEHWDFQEDTDALVEHRLRRHRLYSEATTRAVQEHLGHLKTTRLRSLDAPLDTVAADRALSEWEFLLPLGRTGISGQVLSDVFTRHARSNDERRYALDLTGLPGHALSGMLTGFIDRLVHADNRWGVVDWKSNFLGSRYGDYTYQAMWRCAAGQHYLLQVHLYLVALRRYLRLRASDAIAVSGHLLFLRGILPGTDLGVLEVTPPDALLDDLDSLFARPVGDVSPPSELPT